MDWDDVRTFLAVARAGTLSGAARALRVNHATVARRLASLERDLGAPLFEKTPSGYAPTAAGRAALSEAEVMEAAANALVQGAEAGDQIVGLVRISATANLAEHLLAPGLTDIIARNPGLDLEIVGEDRNVSLTRGDADIALRLGRPASSDALARRLGDLGWRLYASSGYAAATEPADWRFLGFSESVERIAPSALRLRELAGARRVALRCSSVVGQLQAAAAGAGVALLPCYLAETDPRLTLAGPAGRQPDWSQQIWLVVRSDARRIARVGLVAEAIASLVKARGESLAAAAGNSD